MGGNVTTWHLGPAPAVIQPSNGASPASAAQTSWLGFGLLTPFSRGAANDFTSGGGAALVKSAVQQILGTTAQSDTNYGELAWRTEFGSRLRKLRHVPNTRLRRQVARQWAQEAIVQWEPRARITLADVLPTADGRGIVVRIRFDLVSTNPSGNQVLLPDQSVEVSLTP